MRNFLHSLFSLLLLTTLLACSSTPSNNLAQTHTFVIVHGATGGGWDWKTVYQHLTARGHTVYRPTLTGLGERHHLANAEVNLTTHINDVVNTILFEELQNVILVGHSYGGMVISGVANQIPERINHLTYLDAFVPDHGMSAFDLWGTSQDQQKIVDGIVHFSWVDNNAPVPRDVNQPLKTLTEAVSFDNLNVEKINATYIAFTSKPKQYFNSGSWQRAKKRGWTMRTLEGDHVVYRVKPVEMTELLITSTKDTNKQ